MALRVKIGEVAPSVYSMMDVFDQYVSGVNLDSKLKELMRIRASQINGCALCLNMHTKDARKIGEKEQRIDCLSAWREAPFYSNSERAALELTEAVTQISTIGVSDDLYQRVREHFTEEDYVNLVVLLNTINAWNRLSISMKMPVEDE